MITLSDQPARDAILERLDQNMVVEAGAGTGKTRSLVDRVVALIRTGRARLGGIAAITFTESAAAELRARIAESLELAADDESLPQDQRKRCRLAVAELDQAAIQTLHSFAARLLGERPLAAGLPPGFTIRDEIAAEIAFEDRWSAWLD
ncbi:MAG: UvrD-helicase domain-containing protein, partial [Chloroflexi bacterium]|nr:UvrD-helicase domain-containing protein [Chloroflexota bacterium]